MPDYDQLLRLAGVTAMGVTDGGDIGFLDILDAKDRVARSRVRFLLMHFDITKLIGELEALAAAVAKARKASGKDQGPQVATAKVTQSVECQADHQMGAVIVKMAHPNGTTTHLAVKPADIEKLRELLSKGKRDLDQTPDRPVN